MWWGDEGDDGDSDGKDGSGAVVVYQEGDEGECDGEGNKVLNLLLATAAGDCHQ